MDAIAAEAGVGKGTLFRRFGDRAGLALALLHEHTVVLQENMIRGPAPLGPGAPPQERLKAMGRAQLALLDGARRPDGRRRGRQARHALQHRAIRVPAHARRDADPRGRPRRRLRGPGRRAARAARDRLVLLLAPAPGAADRAHRRCVRRARRPPAARSASDRVDQLVGRRRLREESVAPALATDTIAIATMPETASPWSRIRKPSSAAIAGSRLMITPNSAVGSRRSAISSNTNGSSGVSSASPAPARITSGTSSSEPATDTPSGSTTSAATASEIDSPSSPAQRAPTRFVRRM